MGKDYALVAELNNGKKVLLQPDMAQQKCVYRYLTEIESQTNQLDIKANYIWFDTPIYSTLERGETIVFSNIEATPVVFSRI